jgi:nucleolar pre-ribosomal-associated protein 1
LKFIADAMLGAGDEEWKVFRRRHTWDLLASLFQSGRQDRSLRNEIFDVRVPFQFFSLGADRANTRSGTSEIIDLAQPDE